MPTVKVDQQTIYYEIMGKGEPLLLMHGWMQIGRELLPLAKDLATQYRVILPDLPGYGRSTPPQRAFTPDFYKRDAELMSAFLTTLKLSNVHILGYSDGGEVALLMGVTHPELCRSVVSWGAVGYFDSYLCDYVNHVIAPMTISQTDRALHPKQDISHWPAQWAKAFCAITESGGDLSMSRAESMKAPLLLMLGDQDALNPAETGRQFVDIVRKNKDRSSQPIFRLFAQTGHAVHTERPVQFLETVRDFLSQA
jgi:valacyclovir hydrolase